MALFIDSFTASKSCDQPSTGFILPSDLRKRLASTVDFLG
jgi:hypothetical protein